MNMIYCVDFIIRLSLFFILWFRYGKSFVQKLNCHNSVNKNFNGQLLWKHTAIFYASRLYFIQTIKKNSIAHIIISFMLFTIYKEIQIGFGNLLNQYKQRLTKSGIWIFLKKYPDSLNIQKTGILEIMFSWTNPIYCKCKKFNTSNIHDFD